MLIFDYTVIGNKLFSFRKRMGYTQAEVAEKAEISERTYADMERGSVNIRTETLLKICNVLHITPDEILTETGSTHSPDEETILARLNACNPKDKETALQILDVYLKSLK